MSDGKNQLRKIAFRIGVNFFRFAINPENMTKSFPQRTVTVKTKSRIVTEDFSTDVATITIRGTTGYNPTGAAEDRGIRKIKELQKYVQDYANSGGNGRMPRRDFYFHDFTNDESYVVHLAPESIKITQDVNSPLTHRYEISFIILRNAGEPSDDEVIQPEIGTRFPSIPTPSNPNRETTPSRGSLGDVYDQPSASGGADRLPLFQSTINPQTPSPMSYELGMSSLGFLIGYYGRTY